MVDVRAPVLTISRLLFSPLLLSPYQSEGYETHWMSEAGVLDVFLLSGPGPLDVFKQLTTVVGTYQTHRYPV